VISELAGGEWLGPASLAMAAAVKPHIEWMNSTAAAAERAATQAAASAAAYQSAYAMTVPPLVIAANRAQLATLIATNVLGQNTPAILANEAQYAAMWAQDAAAMYDYAAASASAGALPPLKSPTATTNPGGAGAQSTAVSTAGTQSQLNQLVSNAPSVMRGLASPSASTSSNGFLNDLLSSGSNIGIYNDAVALIGAGTNAAAWNGFQAIVTGLTSNASVAGSAAGAAPALIGSGLAPALAGSVAPASVAATPVLAGMSSASKVGGVSIPAAWSAAAPESSTEPLTAAAWTADVDEGGVTNVATGMPAVASTGRSGYGIATPRYGVKPTVMPTQGLV
jgi:PPE-repeat protein